MNSKQCCRILLLLAGALVAFCSCARGPSDNAIKSAITEHLQQRLPLSWAGSLFGAELTLIEVIEIQQRGIFNEKQRYWPIKARVKGICQKNLGYKTEPHEFDRVGDFQLSQDDYGNWKASTEMFQ